MKSKILILTLLLTLITVLTACGGDGELKSFTLTFDSDGGSAVEAITVLDGGTATAPAPPTKENYDFLGWYVGDTEYTFGVSVVRDLSLKAKWSPKEYEIIFDPDSGEANFSQIHVYGNEFTIPIPKREGYNFLGWYLGDERYDFSSITSGASLKARWVEATGGLSLKLSEDEKSYTVTGIGGYSGTELIIPSYVEGKPVTMIESNAFYASGITYLRIPGTVKTVGDMAFARCTSLTEVVTDDGVKEIISSFYGCTALTSVTLADSIVKMDNAFRGCTSLETVLLPESTESANNAFLDCTSLSMNESDGGLYLGTKTNPYFMLMTVKDKTATSFKVNTGTVIIHTGALMDCSLLTELTLPSSIKYIYGNAFKGCASLTTVIIPSSVTTIASFAFAECDSLTTIYIPSSVEVLGYHAFDKCTKLTVSCAVSKAPSGWDADWNMSFLDDEIVTVKVVWSSGAIG